MDITNCKLAKRALEKKIFDLVTSFEKETELSINNIKLNKADISVCSGRKETINFIEVGVSL